MTIIDSKFWRSVWAAIVENEDHEVQAYIGPRPKKMKANVVGPDHLKELVDNGDTLTRNEAEAIFPSLSLIVWSKWKKA